MSRDSCPATSDLPRKGELNPNDLPNLVEVWQPGRINQRVNQIAADESINAQCGFFLAHKGSQVSAGRAAIVGVDGRTVVSESTRTRYKEELVRWGKGWRYERKTVSESELGEMLPKAQVKAREGSQVLAFDAHVQAGYGSYVQAREGTKVQAQEGSVILAQKSSEVWAEFGSRVIADHSSQVTAFRGSRVRALAGSYIIANPGAMVEAEAGSIVTAQPGSVIRARRGSTVSLIEPKDRYIYEPVSLKSEFGSKVVITDPYLKFHPSDVKGAVIYEGPTKGLGILLKNNPDINIRRPKSMTESILGNQGDFRDIRIDQEPDLKPRIPKPVPPPALAPGRSLKDLILNIK